MKKRIFWLGLNFLLVLALLLVADFAFAGGKKEVKETSAAAPGEPQYGGTFTYLSIGAIWGEPTNPDLAAGMTGTTFQYLFPMQEMPFVGDIEKYGPRGTGEFNFDIQAFVPEKFLTGRLIESWEVTPQKVTWHVRQGVYWAPNEQQRSWMKARELTADDVVADLLYFRDSPGGKTFKKFAKDVSATGKYTLVIEWKDFLSQWQYLLGYEDRACITPPEMNKAGAGKWENQVGTGPFVFKEYVVGSYMSFTKNPNWWKKTTINGKEYKLPFVDELVLPIILDESTHMAALRTGKIDVHAVVNPQEWANLKKTAPALLSGPHIGKGWGVSLKCSQPPLDNINVRRALMIGTDRKEFAKLAGAEDLSEHWFPNYGDPTVYTPQEKLPPDTQLLYKYNPELAMKMLKDAGISGLKLQCNITPEADVRDLASLLKDQWSKIGVELTLNTLEGAAFSKERMNRTYQHALMNNNDIANPFNLYRWFVTNEMFNDMAYSNKTVDANLNKATDTLVSLEERNRLCKEAAVMILNDVPRIPLALVVSRHYWWPWGKKLLR